MEKQLPERGFINKGESVVQSNKKKRQEVVERHDHCCSEGTQYIDGDLKTD